MLPQQIAQADFLEILFDDRNKSYGAYLLRKGYNKRLSVAVGSMLFAVLIFFFVYHLFGGAYEETGAAKRISGEIEIMAAKPPVEQPKIAPPPPPPPVKKIASVQFTTPPKIVSDKDVKPDDMPPDTDDLTHRKIGLVTAEGGYPEDIVAPPVDADKGIIALPVQKDDAKEFVPIEIESTYPGGVHAWKRYLMRTLEYPADARNHFIAGPVLVQFIVDVDGSVSNIVALSGPDELKNEAVRVIGKSGKWTPAIQNGRKVKSYKKQVIVFQLNEE